MQCSFQVQVLCATGLQANHYHHEFAFRVAFTGCRSKASRSQLKACHRRAFNAPSDGGKNLPSGCLRLPSVEGVFLPSDAFVLPSERQPEKLHVWLLLGFQGLKQREKKRRKYKNKMSLHCMIPSPVENLGFPKYKQEEAAVRTPTHTGLKSACRRIFKLSKHQTLRIIIIMLMT